MVSLKKININDVRYYCKDNEKLPSVTSIIGSTRDFDLQKCIDRKYKRLIRERGAKKADNTMSLPIKVGNFAHDEIEKWLINNDYSVDKTIAKRFIEQLPLKFLPLLIEHQIFYLVRGYAGTLDLLIEEEDGNITLIDFKTSLKAKSFSQCHDYFVQLAGYGMALQEQLGYRINKYQLIFAYRQLVGVRSPRWSDSFSVCGEGINEYKGEFTTRLAKFKATKEVTI